MPSLETTGCSGVARLCGICASIAAWFAPASVWSSAVVDVLVQVLRVDGRSAGGIDHGDARLGEVALHGAAAVDAGALEAHVVRQLGVGDVELPGDRVHDHVEQDRADAA